VDDGGQVATIIENHVQGLSPSEASDGLLNAPVVLLLCLPLPRKDRDTGGSDTAKRL
jgi:hypothetical protein